MAEWAYNGSNEKNSSSGDIMSLYLRRVRGHRLLSRTEEAELSRRIQEGDEEAWSELVRHNLRLVISLARGYVGRGLEFSDLVQEGNLGLMRAARSFDTQFGTKFSTYATWWIKQSIGRAIANKAAMIRIPIHAAEDERAVNAALNHLRDAAGQEPSMEELSEFLGKRTEEVKNALNYRKAVISYDSPIGTEEDGALSDLIADAIESGTEAPLMEGAMQDSVRELVDSLQDRQRYVIRRRYGLDGQEPATLEQIGRELGVTRERARQIQLLALRRLQARAARAELRSFLELSGSPA